MNAARDAGWLGTWGCTLESEIYFSKFSPKSDKYLKISTPLLQIHQASKSDIYIVIQKPNIIEF